ncbi:MAG: CHAD domain-containing protein [Marinospirillum sp.]|uniref:CHAD domain-containing protein n=1 Tax=Marinospirillum sp. TaxID=2183934 RepID=UPI0019ECA2D5|nr:CHAD domain-containing protein [Marinospirillum sp.]MBE0507424.1 CHAD domain-containing protein [Marinospirillum sp.]
MMDAEQGCWLLNKEPNKKRLQNLLGSSLKLTDEDQWQSTRCLLDDFDWHLHQAGLTLFYTSQNRQQVLNSEASLYEGEALLCRQPLTQHPRFWQDLPEGELQDQLKKHLGLNSLRAVLQVAQQHELLACRDDEGKVVLRLEILRQQIHSLASEETPRKHRILFRLLPLRGYASEAAKVMDLLDKLLLEPAQPLKASELLEFCALNPQQACPDNLLPHDASEATATALRHTALQFLQQARRYEPGILADTDTEFLHQYRVNLRRVRSLLSLLKQALPQEQGRQLRQRLAALAANTGQLRDLDVFLLQKDFYQQLLPQVYRPGLEALLKTTARQRKKIHQTLTRQLLATTHESDYHWLQQQLAVEVPEDLLDASAPLANLPLGEVATQKIRKSHKRICRFVADLDENTPDEQVHELRIECKKLRYLLDFFSLLYPAEQIKPQLKALKRLQNILGDFNDFGVQQVFLLQQLQANTPPEQVAAVNGLVALLYSKQLLARNKVMKALAAYAAQPLQLEITA